MIDNFLYTATGAQIAVDPFTTGVTTFTYGEANRISGGTPLFFGTGGQPFVAYELNVDVPYIPAPVPTTIWLLGSGLLILMGLRRKYGK